MQRSTMERLRDPGHGLQKKGGRSRRFSMLANA